MRKKIPKSNFNIFKEITIPNNSKSQNYKLPSLIMNKNKKDIEIYFRLDTHWNDYGAFIGYSEMIRKYEKGLQIPNAKIIDKGSQNRVGDLKGFLGISTMMVENNIDVKFLDNITYTLETTTQYNHTHCDNSLINRKIVVIGDSFSNGLMQYFSKTYVDAYYMTRSQANNISLIELEPNIVIEEAVERYTSALLDYSIK